MMWSDLWGWSLEKDETKIRVRVGCRVAMVEVEEFHPYEPSAYVWDPGWTCFDGAGQEFFVSSSGGVWKQPENKEVGVVWYPKARVVEFIPALFEL
jgi:hypothetical protein